MNNAQAFMETRILDLNYVICIVASPGGFEPLKTMIKGTPAVTGLSFIILQHGMPDYSALLCEMISEFTDMKVVLAENEMVLLKNTVYIIKPNMGLGIINNRFKLTALLLAEIKETSDDFIRTTMNNTGSRALATVIFGAGVTPKSNDEILNKEVVETLEKDIKEVTFKKVKDLDISLVKDTSLISAKCSIFVDAIMARIVNVKYHDLDEEHRNREFSEIIGELQVIKDLFAKIANSLEENK